MRVRHEALFWFRVCVFRLEKLSWVKPIVLLNVAVRCCSARLNIRAECQCDYMITLLWKWWAVRTAIIHFATGYKCDWLRLHIPPLPTSILINQLESSKQYNCSHQHTIYLAPPTPVISYAFCNTFLSCSFNYSINKQPSFCEQLIIISLKQHIICAFNHHILSSRNIFIYLCLKLTSS